MCESLDTCLVCDIIVLRYTFEVQCTLPTKYTIVKRSTMIICQLNIATCRYCRCILKWNFLLMATVHTLLHPSISKLWREQNI